MAERTTNSMVEIRQKFMKEIAQAKLLVESEDDMAELLELETFIIQKSRGPIESMQAQGQLPPDGAYGAAPSFQGDGGVRGVPTSGPPMTSMDEMRRMLA
jgi:hypothetical protein